MRKWLAMAIVAGLVLAVPLGVIAATTRVGSRLERQRAISRSGSVSTSSQNWRTIRGMRKLICSIGEVSAAATVNVTGTDAGLTSPELL